jgi:multidrug efflux pump subunit AcrA (membrane-fusion protein)
VAGSRDKRGIWLAQLALATFALLLTPLGMEAEPRHGHDDGEAPSVGAGEATPLPELDCVIEPDTTVAVGSRVQGVLDTVYVDRGDRVTAGQTLAELDSEIESAGVALARARAEMDAELQAKQANLGLGERRAARNERLFESRAISFEAKDEGETNAVLAAFELEQTRQSRTVAELELARAAVSLDQRRIVSPIDGIVVERAMSPGELGACAPRSCPRRPSTAAIRPRSASWTPSSTPPAAPSGCGSSCRTPTTPFPPASAAGCASGRRRT